MEKLRFEMRGEIAHVDMYGPIGDPFGGITSDQFVSVMNQVKRAKPPQIDFHINSEGGSVDEGVAIFHRMSDAREWAKIRTVVEGRAWSAASLLLLPGHEREMLHGTRLMVHEAAFPRGGRADEMRKMAGVLDSINSEAAQLYANNTNWSAEEARAAMEAETWIDADQAFKFGFTTVAPSGAIQPDTSLFVPSEVFAMFKNPPLELAMEQADLQRETDKRLEKLKAIQQAKRDENEALIRQIKTDHARSAIASLPEG